MARYIISSFFEMFSVLKIKVKKLPINLMKIVKWMANEFLKKFRFFLSLLLQRQTKTNHNIDGYLYWKWFITIFFQSVITEKLAKIDRICDFYIYKKNMKLIKFCSYLRVQHLICNVKPIICISKSQKTLLRSF